MRRTLILSAALVALVSCNRGGDESGDTAPNNDECGDVDGDGGDTGDVPNVLGNWTSDVGKNLFTEDCGLEGFKEGSDLPFDGAMEIKGRIPDQLYVEFDDNETQDVKFWGVVSPSGAVAFSGQYESRHGMVHVAMGGLAYWNEYTSRYYIDGFAFYGISTDDDDTTIECTARAEWTATKSGA